MNSSVELSNRFNEVFLNGNWVVSTNIYDQLSRIPWEYVVKNTGCFNSTEFIAYHIHYYIRGVLEVLEGGRLTISDKYSSDFYLNQSATEWISFLETYKLDCEKFVQILKNMSNDDFEKDFFENKYGSYSKNINALIEHGYYHLGQIILIKKQLGVM